MKNPISANPLQFLNRAVSKNAKGAPGLAFETWDPCNQCVMNTHDVTTGCQALEALLIPFARREPGGRRGNALIDSRLCDA